MRNRIKIKKFIVGIFIIITCMTIIIPFTIYGQSQDCEDNLRKKTLMLDIMRTERDQADIALTELFTRYKDAIRQIEELKTKEVKPEEK